MKIDLCNFFKKNLVEKGSCKKSTITIKGNTSVNQVRVRISVSQMLSAT